MDTTFIKEMANDIANATRSAFLVGLKEGIRRFAWWKDGVQYVGTTGTTLKEALKKAEEEFDGK